LPAGVKPDPKVWQREGLPPLNHGIVALFPLPPTTSRASHHHLRLVRDAPGRLARRLEFAWNSVLEFAAPCAILSPAMSKITIADLEVFYCVGVEEAERAQPQRLLLTVDISYDFTSAAISDRVTKTINYYEVAQFLLKFGEGRSWKLIEKLAVNVTDEILTHFSPQAVTIQVKKFSVPQAAYVSVTWTRRHG
jgi:dihydroneopterin aldolase